mmetsp:Transcript_22396/g.62885  ORF Transcript_22396/g.62885 Transcript_22396/m.62885 type:complete len:433 (+) Transcript_22396:96-1394(+)
MLPRLQLRDELLQGALDAEDQDAHPDDKCAAVLDPSPPRVCRLHVDCPAGEDMEQAWEEYVVAAREDRRHQADHLQHVGEEAANNVQREYEHAAGRLVGERHRLVDRPAAGGLEDADHAVGQQGGAHEDVHNHRGGGDHAQSGAVRRHERDDVVGRPGPERQVAEEHHRAVDRPDDPEGDAEHGVHLRRVRELGPHARDGGEDREAEEEDGRADPEGARPGRRGAVRQQGVVRAPRGAPPRGGAGGGRRPEAPPEGALREGGRQPEPPRHDAQALHGDGRDADGGEAGELLQVRHHREAGEHREHDGETDQHQLPRPLARGEDREVVHRELHVRDQEPHEREVFRYDQDFFPKWAADDGGEGLIIAYRCGVHLLCDLAPCANHNSAFQAGTCADNAKKWRCKHAHICHNFGEQDHTSANTINNHRSDSLSQG